MGNDCGCRGWSVFRHLHSNTHWLRECAAYPFHGFVMTFLKMITAYLESCKSLSVHTQHRHDGTLPKEKTNIGIMSFGKCVHMFKTNKTKKTRDNTKSLTTRFPFGTIERLLKRFTFWFIYISMCKSVCVCVHVLQRLPFWIQTERHRKYEGEFLQSKKMWVWVLKEKKE